MITQSQKMTFVGNIKGFFNFLSTICNPPLLFLSSKFLHMKLVASLLIVLFNMPCFAQVTAPGLTAVYEDRRQRVKLKWNHQDARVVTYILQKSANNSNWSNFQQVATTAAQRSKLMSFADERPGQGKNYYRLKAVTKDGSIQFTPSIMVIIGQPGNNWLLYPVPVTDVLNLQYNGNDLIPGVIAVFIQNSSGRAFHKLRYASSTRLIRIPVGNLGKGIYDIRIVIEDRVVWNQRFVK